MFSPENEDVIMLSREVKARVSLAQAKQMNPIISECQNNGISTCEFSDRIRLKNRGNR